MFQSFKAPDRTQPMISAKKIFLAGSIDMGEAEDWQEEITKKIEDLSKKSLKNVCVFNPRRDDWDSSWEQDINNTQFFDQVSWELDRIDDSDLVIFFFGKDSKSPITLLELGKVSEMKDKEVLVCCPKGFYRKGNVDITCHRKKIPVFETIDDIMKEVGTFLKIEDSNTKEEVKEEFSIEETVQNALDAAKDAIELEENQIKLKALHGDPIFEYTTGEENILVVEDYEAIENSCMMGRVKFNGRTMYTGICNEDGKTKINMNIQKSDGSEELVEFEIKKVDENLSESIILAE